MNVSHEVQVCRKKLRHRSMRHALDERDRLLAKQGVWTEVFHCQVCGGIHLGTPYSQQRRARRSA